MTFRLSFFSVQMYIYTQNDTKIQTVEKNTKHKLVIN